MQILKEDESDVRLLVRCEAKEVMCKESAGMKDKSWLRSLEEGPPRPKEEDFG